MINLQMAKKRIPRNAKNVAQQFAGKFCRDCAHAKEWHSQALDGHMILCKCIHHKEGKWSQFLSAPACMHFVQREEFGDE